MDASVLQEMVAQSPLPVIFTCRPQWQGGSFLGPENERRQLLERAAVAGAAYIDVEIEAEWASEFVTTSPVPVILSHHWEQPRPPDLETRAAAMAACQPAIVKMVAPASVAADSLPLLRAGAELVQQGQATAAFCSGEAGRASRLLVAAYGGALTYAAGPKTGSTAPGQWPLQALVREIRIGRWRRDQRLCGLLGHPLGHSLSPTIFNAAFDAQQLDLGYAPLASESFETAMQRPKSSA